MASTMTLGCFDCMERMRQQDATIRRLRRELRKLRRVVPDTAPWFSLCVECGPNVGVDEDGCCAGCGATAMGAWLDSLRALAPKRPAKRKK